MPRSHASDETTSREDVLTLELLEEIKKRQRAPVVPCLEGLLVVGQGAIGELFERACARSRCPFRKPFAPAKDSED